MPSQSNATPPTKASAAAIPSMAGRLVLIDRLSFPAAKSAPSFAVLPVVPPGRACRGGRRDLVWFCCSAATWDCKLLPGGSDTQDEDASMTGNHPMRQKILKKPEPRSTLRAEL